MSNPILNRLDYECSNTLIMHELLHRIQDELGFPGVESKNPHLDELMGRFYLKMEWRALAAALTSSGKELERASRDALLFRLARRSEFPGADSTENAFEMHEGLAECTGTRLGGLPLDDIRPLVAERLLSVEDKMSYSNSFAYLSGAGYGILLDALEADWRSVLTPGGDFGGLLRDRLEIDVPPDPASAAGERYAAYNGKELLAGERKLERKRQARLAGFRKRFVDGPVLVLPNASMKLSYNPHKIYDLGRHGTVYGYLIAIADWGRLTAEGGGLRSPDWSRLTVSAESISSPENGTVSGEGWTLEVAPGWKVVESAGKGSYTVEME